MNDCLFVYMKFKAVNHVFQHVPHFDAKNGSFVHMAYCITSHFRLLPRDGHNTDTKYRYCRYLRVRVKYRYFHQVSLVFDTEPELFMVSMIV